MIVITLDRAMRPARTEAVGRGEQRRLRPRLARRSGDADDPAMAARTRRDTERVQRRRAVGDADVREVDRTFADDARRARRDRLVDAFVPVGRLALPRDEEIALPHLARVEGDALHGEVGPGRAAGRRSDGPRGTS